MISNLLKLLLKGEKIRNISIQYIMNFKKIGLSSIQAKDSAPHRLIMWNAYKKNILLARYTEKLFHKPNFQKAVIFARFFICLINLTRFKIPKEKYNIWGLYSYQNEFRAIKRFLQSAPPDLAKQSSAMIQFGRISLIKIPRVFFHAIYLFKQALHDLPHLERSSFLVTMRQVDFLFYYYYWCRHLKANPDILPKIVISSTESNPEIIGPALAVKLFNVFQLYINHGSLASDLGLFFHDLFFVSNHDFRQKIQSHYYTNDNVCCHVMGARSAGQQIKALSTKSDQKILIIGSILSNNEKITRLLRNYTKAFPLAKIYFRPHPNKALSNPLPKQLLKDLPFEIVTNDETVKKQAKDYDIILVGNSSAAQELMEELIPSFYVDIDDSPYDTYGFIQQQFIPVGDLPANLKNEYETVYFSAAWEKTLEYFCPLKNKSDLDDFWRILQKRF